MKKVFLPMVLSLLLVGSAYSKAAAVATNSVPITPDSAPNSTNSKTLTPAEWQEVRTARQAALKANPGLVAKAAQLSAKMRAFEQKLDAAMVKRDPKLAPILAKFENGHQPAKVPPAAAPAH